jgi:shikimate dehydrogenase
LPTSAHNTDVTGFRAALEDFLGDRAVGGTVLQIGAGGAGLATASALIDLGFDAVVVHDVVPAAAEALIGRFSGTSHVACPGRLHGSGGSLDAWLPRVDGVVHVTPVGMAEHPGVAFDVDRLGPGSWVAEVVYRPLETELVRRARARGLATLDGGGMAVGQAVESMRLITGLRPDAARMHAHFNQLVAVRPTT